LYGCLNAHRGLSMVLGIWVSRNRQPDRRLSIRVSHRGNNGSLPEGDQGNDSEENMKVRRGHENTWLSKNRRGFCPPDPESNLSAATKIWASAHGTFDAFAHLEGMCSLVPAFIHKPPDWAASIGLINAFSWRVKRPHHLAFGQRPGRSSH
jgi:hypothetical protein